MIRALAIAALVPLAVASVAGAQERPAAKVLPAPAAKTATHPPAQSKAPSASKPGARSNAKPAAEASASTAPLVSAEQAGVRARIEPEAARAEIGEPVRWVLSIDHPETTRVLALAPDTGLAWIVLDGPRAVRAPLASGRATTRVEWTIAALEPGTQKLPAPSIEVESGGETSRVLAETAEIEVAPALAAGEDAPRPMRGFLPPPPDAVPAPRWPWFAAALVLALAFFLWRRRRHSAPVAARPPAPLEALAELERRLQAEPEAARAIVFDASRLAREAVDAALGESRAALTDEDWSARTRADARLPDGVRGASARLLEGFERAKYALEVPTRFALAERLADLRHLLEALPAPQTTSAPAAMPAEKKGAAA